ncbi:hypothetical protein, partial [Streptococcus sobrinus]
FIRKRIRKRGTEIALTKPAISPHSLVLRLQASRYRRRYFANYLPFLLHSLQIISKFERNLSQTKSLSQTPLASLLPDSGSF